MEVAPTGICLCWIMRIVLCCWVRTLICCRFFLDRLADNVYVCWVWCTSNVRWSWRIVLVRCRTTLLQGKNWVRWADLVVSSCTHSSLTGIRQGQAFVMSTWHPASDQSWGRHRGSEVPTSSMWLRNVAAESRCPKTFGDWIPFSL